MVLIAILVAVGIVVLVAVLRAGDERVSMPTFREAGSPSVDALIAAGRKIDAIKLYRQQHGVGLREAKEAVEEVERTGPRPIPAP